MDIRYFGPQFFADSVQVPDLTEIQNKAYERFLQPNTPIDKRDSVGLQALLHEVFPIENFDGSIKLRFMGYELGKPRYNPDECRRLKLTYGAPLKIKVILDRAEPVEEDVYLGDIPLMIGGGEFIINGAERVIVTQLHRSPGVDFSEDDSIADRKCHSCWVIPERGSWVEIAVSKKDTLQVKIDQNGKFSAITLLRAMYPEFSSSTDLLRTFYQTEVVKTAPKFENKVQGTVNVVDIVDPETGEIVVAAGAKIDETAIANIKKARVKDVEIIPGMQDPLVINSLEEDTTKSHEDALLRIYQRLRPGNPANMEKAKQLMIDKFFDDKRYRLGAVGRFRLNRKFGHNIDQKHMILVKEDLIECIRYILKLRVGQGEIDDIDHLGNRRIRTIDELAAEELRNGFLKLRRTIQDRLNQEDKSQLTPREIINSKTISSAIEFFFGRSELSQVVDQTNPLSQITHERRLSALGPGGLNRKRAGFDARDVHISHYGRICPIETPEGANIGLITSLAIYATADLHGFLITPYRVVKNGKVTGELAYLRADQENHIILAPADTPVEDSGKFLSDQVLARLDGDFLIVDKNEVKYMDASPMQLVGVSSSLIPFLEHDDANRALMGSNMQRQAVPLLTCEPPQVATGMEKVVAGNSSMVIRAEEDGVVTYADAEQIAVGETVYKLRKFFGLNERTCLNQKPIVMEGDKVKKGQVIADGAGTYKGELSLGKNLIVAFMPWDGYNFEDAILVSERLVKDDVYTSIHIESFEIEIRETKLGREEFTNDIPNVPERALKNLGTDGVVRIGTFVRPGDILVGKVAPKSKGELSPEEKLLRAIFGRSGEDVKNESLEVPSGVEGIVIDTRKYSRKLRLTEEERKKTKREVKAIEKEYNSRISILLKKLVKDLKTELDGDPTHKETRQPIKYPGLLTATKDVTKLKDSLSIISLEIPNKAAKEKVRVIIDEYRNKIEPLEEEREREINKLLRGVELPTGVLEMVKVYVATKRRLSVGDKVAGRHGNKGVISRILPQEDMPFLEDGTPVDIVLNPLGVPSRMNVGQILETHLGMAARKLGFQAVTPVFAGAREQDVIKCLREAGIPDDGQTSLYDGRTGERFDERVTVGIMYMMKLHHLVDDKVHARATGPYSLITQQPLGGKARFGGQRFGEMEVWALEAYGAANILQELLTVKSDDVDGRTKIYESMVKGENILEPGTPVSFEVLTNEIRGLGLNMVLEKKKV